MMFYHSKSTNTSLTNESLFKLGGGGRGEEERRRKERKRNNYFWSSANTQWSGEVPQD